jgi:4-hydroxybenzoate polyprenyltransferase
LARSCHPLPTVAVTAISCALAALAGDSGLRVVLVTAAVFVGQLSIGWSNDAIDAERDRHSQRADKPVAAGAVPLGVVTRAAGLALVLAIALSALLGPRAGAAALLIVAAGWAYNAGLKATLWSWVPYALAFGALPAVATLARTDHAFPAGWAVAAGALLGVAAHLANVAPDLADDAATGVRGMPHRLGRRGTSRLGPVLLAAAVVVVFVGAGSAHSWWRIVTLAVSLSAAGAAAVIASRTEPGRRYFIVTLIAAGLDVLLFGLSGHRLS